MVRLLVIGLSVGLFLLSIRLVSDAADKADAKDKFDLSVAGKLSADDPKDRISKGFPHKVHEFKMKAKSFFVIELASKDFDSLLRLEDSKGNELASDAERVVFKAPKDDTYRIIVTMFGGKPGNYKLTVRQGTEEEFYRANPLQALIGKPAPEIVGAFAVSGTTTKLSALKGKVVLLDFWAVWCKPCVASFPHLREWNRQFKKDGLEILGVTGYEQMVFDKEKGSLKKVENLKAAEEHATLKDFVAHHKATHQIMVVDMANHKKAQDDYKVEAIPQVVLIDRKGTVRMVHVGVDPDEIEAEIRTLLAEK